MKTLQLSLQPLNRNFRTNVRVIIQEIIVRTDECNNRPLSKNSTFTKAILSEPRFKNITAKKTNSTLIEQNTKAFSDITNENKQPASGKGMALFLV